MKSSLLYGVPLLCSLVFGAGNPEPPLLGKRGCFIIASENFRDEELDVPRRMLEDEGVRVVVASRDTLEATGMLGMKVKPDVRIEDLDPLDFDALVLVGGSGARMYFDDPEVHERVSVAADSGRIVAAICIAPVTLAKAGLLKGKDATSFPSVISELSACGAHAKRSAVVVDGRIVTADGPEAARPFAKEILKLLRGN